MVCLKCARHRAVTLQMDVLQKSHEFEKKKKSSIWHVRLEISLLCCEHPVHTCKMLIKC